MKHLRKERDRKKHQRRKGQNIVEYSILFSIIVGAVLSMQLFVKRGLQGRYRDGVGWMAARTGDLGDTGQYEPYFFESSYEVSKGQDETKTLTGSTNFEVDSYGWTQRKAGGYQVSTYDDEGGGGVGPGIKVEHTQTGNAID